MLGVVATASRATGECGAMVSRAGKKTNGMIASDGAGKCDAGNLAFDCVVFRTAGPVGHLTLLAHWEERRRSKCYCAILVHLTRGCTHWLQIWVFVVQQARIRHSWREPIDDSRGTACRARGRNLAMSSHLSRVRIQRGTLVARRAMDGVPLLVARSGTACRAPTGETATAKNVVAVAASIAAAAVCYLWRRLKPTLLESHRINSPRGAWFLAWPFLRLCSRSASRAIRRIPSESAHG